MKSFTLASNDSIPGWGEAVFTIEDRLDADTGLVYNKDSIRFGTPLDKVLPKFTFSATIAWATMQIGDTTITLTGSDSIDLTEPVYLTICSQDKSTQKTYKIVATIHQVDPDLYTWEKVCDQIYPEDESEQQLLFTDYGLVLFKHNGLRIQCAGSMDGGSTWSTLQNVTGLPSTCSVRQIVTNEEMFYYGEGHTLYISADARDWDYIEVEDSIVSTVMCWNELPWFALSDGEHVELAYWTLVGLHRTGLKVKANEWPVSGFATAQFETLNDRLRAMILGGYNARGKELNTNWQLDCNPSLEGGYRIENFSTTYDQTKSLTGASIVWYNDQLMLFGAKLADNSYLGRNILISTNEGTTWQTADTTENILPESYTARYYTNVCTDGEYIYLVGGRDEQNRTHSDVYRGRLNSILWDK